LPVANTEIKLMPICFSDLETLEESIDGIIKHHSTSFVHLEIVPGVGPSYPYVRISDAVDQFRAALERS